MRLSAWLVAATLLASGVVSGCGDIGMVNVTVDFPDEDTELLTRALRFIVREVPGNRDGCEDLWLMAPTNLPQSESVVEYPNRTDVVAAPVRLAMYKALTILVYAHKSTDVQASPAIAGGCKETPVSGDESSEVMIPLMVAP